MNDAEVLFDSHCYIFYFVLLLRKVNCNLAGVIANGQPSLTAFTAAAARAAHLIVDDDPPIFADTLAEAMLGERAGELIGFHRAHGTHPILAGAGPRSPAAAGTPRTAWPTASGAASASTSCSAPACGFLRQPVPAGEPWLSLFAPDEAAALLRRHGFGPVRDVGQRDMVPPPLWERTDSLRPADLSRIAHARIPGNAHGRIPAGRLPAR